MNKKSYFKILLSFFLLFGFCIVVKAADSGIPLQVPLPGQGNTVKDLSSYIASWYTFGISAIGIIAVIMIMWSGLQWITAMGNASQIGQARERLSNAIIGLVLALCSYGLLYLINPALVELKSPNIKYIEKEEITGGETEMTKQKCSDDADCLTNGAGKIVYDYICFRYNCSDNSKEIPPENRTCIYRQEWQKCAKISPVCATYGKGCDLPSPLGTGQESCCDFRLVCHRGYTSSKYTGIRGYCREISEEGQVCTRDEECAKGLKCDLTGIPVNYKCIKP